MASQARGLTDLAARLHGAVASDASLAPAPARAPAPRVRSAAAEA